MPTQNVLIIGGMGFIGKHLVRACNDIGMKVRVADVVTPEVVGSENVEYLKGDYREPLFLKSILEGMQFVVHLVHDTMLLNLDCNMAAEFERNIKPAMRLMDECCSHQVEKLLFVSSGGTVYGNHKLHKPITEQTRTRPISLYGTSKLMIEQMGFLYHIQKNLPLVVARPANAYGSGQKPFCGQGFISTAFASALEGRPLNIFGDGKIIRDYIHVYDLAAAIVALLKSGQIGKTYNVGTGVGISLGALLDEYIEPILALDGVELIRKHTSSRGVDVPYNVLANDKIFRDTGFSPHISIEDGLMETWSWLKQTYAKTD